MNTIGKDCNGIINSYVEDLIHFDNYKSKMDIVIQHIEEIYVIYNDSYYTFNGIASCFTKFVNYSEIFSIIANIDFYLFDTIELQCINYFTHIINRNIQRGNINF